MNILFSRTKTRHHICYRILGFAIKIRSTKLMCADLEQRLEEKFSTHKKELANCKAEIANCKAEIAKSETELQKLRADLHAERKEREGRVAEIEQHLLNVMKQNAKEQRDARIQLERKIMMAAAPEQRDALLKLWYAERTGRVLDLVHPKTFQEKIQWSKLYDTDPIRSVLADKVAVRDFVAEKIGSEYLVPIYGVWDDPADIDFDSLPQSFVLKCNHGSGFNIVVVDKSKLDIPRTRRQLALWLASDFAFHAGFEMHYSKIPRRIMAEEYIAPGVSNFELQAYCFDGQVKFVSYETNKDSAVHRRCMMTCDWTPAGFKLSPQAYAEFDTLPGKPTYLDKFLRLASTLSQPARHVRVDFIVINDKLFFRELTLTSGSGLSIFDPPSAAEFVGNMYHLPCDGGE